MNLKQIAEQALKTDKEKNLEISLFYTCVPKILMMIYSSRDIETDKMKLVILGHVLPFYSPKNQKDQNFEKHEKKLLEISSLYDVQ